MTTQQKDAIRSMRLDGASYSRIAATLGLSVNTIKSYMRRDVCQQDPEPTDDGSRRCPRCGEQFFQKPLRKTKLFCSSKCRQAWWYANRVHSKTARMAACGHCGASFPASRDQKYCSHMCYIRARFGGDAHARRSV